MARAHRIRPSTRTTMAMPTSPSTRLIGPVAAKQMKMAMAAATIATTPVIAWNGSREAALAVKDQALRILAASLAQFDSDPMQAVRASRQQAETLKALAASTGDINLAIAANGLDAYLGGGGVTKDGLAQPIGAILALGAPSPQARAG